MAVVNANAYAQGAGYIYLCPYTNPAVPRYAAAHYHRHYSLSGEPFPLCQNLDSGNAVSLTFVPGDMPLAMKQALAAFQVEG